MKHEKLEKLLREHGPAISRRFREAEDRPCPSAELLQAFARGKLPQVEARQVAHHLLSCEPCSRLLLAWRKIEEEDDMEEALIEAREERERKGWAAVFFKRYRYSTAAALAAAALLLLAFFIWPQGKPFYLEAQLVSAAGTLRSPVVRTGEAVALNVKIPKKAYLVVFAVNGGQVEQVFPENKTAEFEKGTVRVPGPHDAWRLEDFKPGRYAFVVAASRRPPSEQDVAGALEALRRLPVKHSEDSLRTALADYFEAVSVVPFVVTPK